jgi:fused signal recognition particle receptor
MSFSNTLKSFLGLYTGPDEAFFDELCDLLVEGDFPAAAAVQTVDLLREACKKERLTTAGDVTGRLGGILLETLRAAHNDAAYPDIAGGLTVIMLLGVNGVGKTTTAATLAALFKGEGRPILAGADTFRAAAIDQLKTHGERLGVRVVAGRQGGDAAACVYDTLEAAAAGGYNPVIVDTAGRMHTKSALVDELKKLDRVIGARCAGGAYKKYLVLDSTTGTNAVFQAETFCEAVRPDGVILTKCDSTAKGGVVFPLAASLRLPVLYLCSGEKYENIAPFNAEKYVNGFLGA